MKLLKNEFIEKYFDEIRKRITDNELSNFWHTVNNFYDQYVDKKTKLFTENVNFYRDIIHNGIDLSQNLFALNFWNGVDRTGEIFKTHEGYNTVTYITTNYTDDFVSYFTQENESNFNKRDWYTEHTDRIKRNKKIEVWSLGTVKPNLARLYALDDLGLYDLEEDYIAARAAELMFDKGKSNSEQDINKSIEYVAYAIIFSCTTKVECLLQASYYADIPHYNVSTLIAGVLLSSDKCLSERMWLKKG